MKMTKRMICLIVAAVAVFSLLVLPVMKVEVSYSGRVMASESGNFFDILDALFDEFCYIAWLLAILAGAAVIYAAAVMKDKNITFIASAAAAGLTLLSWITFPSESAQGMEVSASAGIGLWIGLLGFAATAVMVKMFDKEWDDEQ